MSELDSYIRTARNRLWLARPRMRKSAWFVRLITGSWSLSGSGEPMVIVSRNGCWTRDIVFHEIPMLKLVAVHRGFLHLHWMANNDDPNIVPMCSFFSFLETAELRKIFSLYEYEIGRSYPYIMLWPSSLVCNTVNLRTEGA